MSRPCFAGFRTGYHRRCVWSGLWLLLAGATAGGAAAPEPPQQAPRPVFKAEVSLVAVPVFVTDRSGKAVPGLTAADFEVYDGGRRVPIAAFQSVSVRAPAAAPEAAPEPSAELPMAVQAAAPRQFVLLFDLQFSPPAGIVRARSAAIRFVRESLGPGDLVAAATFGRGGLTMLTNLTSDRSHVARSIESLGLAPAIEASSDPLGLGGEFAAFSEMPGGAQLLDASSNPLAAGGDLAVFSGMPGDAELAASLGLLKKHLLRAYRYRISDFLVSLQDLAEALSNLRGRKQIVLLSGGFHQKAWVGPESEAERADEPTWMRIQSLMDDVFGAADHSDVVIHAVDLGGIEGPIDIGSRTGQIAGGVGSGRRSLGALAENTGGRFVQPTNDFALALREVDEVSHHYYVLAFEPVEPADKPDRPRSLKVRVRGDGLKVSHRKAYVLPASPRTPDAAATRLLATEAIAKGLSGGPLGLDLLALPYRHRDGAPAVAAALQIEGPALASAARDERLEVEVYGYALAGGHVLDSLQLPTTLDLTTTAASLPSAGLWVLTAFAVQPGAVDLRFFVRAGDAGMTGSLARRVEVPRPVEGEIALSPPLFPLPGTGRVAVSRKTQNGSHLESPFRLGDEYVLPDTATLRPGQPRDLCVLVWAADAGASAPLEVAGEIVRPGEAPLSLHIEGVPQVEPDAEGFDRYLMTVVPPRASPGDYTLRLTFRDPGTGRTSLSETAIVLEE